MSRNAIAILLVLITAALWGQSIGQRETVAFQPIESLPGWREYSSPLLTRPGGSATDAVLAGLNAPEPATLAETALCRFLYPEAPTGLPATYFTDFNCPNCRSLEAKLRNRRDNLDLRIIDLPLLGPTSEVYARVMLALELQQSALPPSEFTALSTDARRMQSGPRIHPLVADAVREAGLDLDRLRADMTGPKVAARLARNQAAANTLGVYGTPALALGRTLIMGDVSHEVLDQIIALELARSREGCTH